MNEQNNPGIGTKGKCTFSNDENEWIEEFDLIALLTQVLSEKEIDFEFNDEIVVADGICFKPGIVEIIPLEPKGVRTVTTIEYSHDVSNIHGIFEYQHATGDDLSHSLKKGFEYWVDTDFYVITEALTGKFGTCNKLLIENPDGLKKVILLGNPMRLTQSTHLDDPEHPFCPCCLFTNSFTAFDNLFRNTGFYALRLLVSKDVEGNISADCRLNGIDYELGVAALCEYGKKWPNNLFDMRKQYVILMDDRASH